MLCRRGFFGARVCWLLLCLCRPFMIFEVCLDSPQRTPVMKTPRITPLSACSVSMDKSLSSYKIANESAVFF